MHASNLVCMKTCLHELTQSCHRPNMLVAFVNQKGGVGKTTLAVHFAAWLHDAGRRVALIDADGQASSSNWLRAGEPGVNVVVEQNADELIETVARLRKDQDFIIADGPANLSETTRALLLVADLAVLPCGVTLPELESTAATVRMLRNAREVRGCGQPPGLVVLTRLRNPQFHLTRESRAAAAALGLPVCRAFLKLREAVADAPGQRSLVWRMGKPAKAAADEMTTLMMEIQDYARTSTQHAGSTDERTASVFEAA